MSIEIPNWVPPVVSLCGSIVGAFVGVKLAVMELKLQMIEVFRRLDGNDRKWVEHDARYAEDIQQFAVMRDRAGLSRKPE